MGDRPLRSPTHRRLGGPSPRLPSNGTHARPRPRLRFDLGEMPHPGRMAYYPAFPPAVRLSGAGCIRVAHPSATLNPPKGGLPFDLHVLGLPLAFILSQDQTLHCILLYFKLFCSTWRIHLFVSPLEFSRFLTFQTMLLLAHCFQRTCNLRFLSIADAKVHTFLFHATLFAKKI